LHENFNKKTKKDSVFDKLAGKWQKVPGWARNFLQEALAGAPK
jgi:hypothetical protein